MLSFFNNGRVIETTDNNKEQQVSLQTASSFNITDWNQFTTSKVQHVRTGRR